MTVLEERIANEVDGILQGHLRGSYGFEQKYFDAVEGPAVESLEKVLIVCRT